MKLRQYSARSNKIEYQTTKVQLKLFQKLKIYDTIRSVKKSVKNQKLINQQLEQEIASKIAYLTKLKTKFSPGVKKLIQQNNQIKQKKQEIQNIEEWLSINMDLQIKKLKIEIKDLALIYQLNILKNYFLKQLETFQQNSLQQIPSQNLRFFLVRKKDPKYQEFKNRILKVIFYLNNFFVVYDKEQISKTDYKLPGNQIMIERIMVFLKVECFNIQINQIFGLNKEIQKEILNFDPKYIQNQFKKFLKEKKKDLQLQNLEQTIVGLDELIYWEQKKYDLILRKEIYFNRLKQKWEEEFLEEYSEFFENPKGNVRVSSFIKKNFYFQESYTKEIDVISLDSESSMHISLEQFKRKSIKDLFDGIKSYSDVEYKCKDEEQYEVNNQLKLFKRTILNSQQIEDLKLKLYYSCLFIDFSTEKILKEFNKRFNNLLIISDENLIQFMKSNLFSKMKYQFQESEENKLINFIIEDNSSLLKSIQLQQNQEIVIVRSILKQLFNKLPQNFQQQLNSNFIKFQKFFNDFDVMFKKFYKNQEYAINNQFKLKQSLEFLNNNFFGNNEEIRKVYIYYMIRDKDTLDDIISFQTYNDFIQLLSPKQSNFKQFQQK